MNDFDAVMLRLMHSANKSQSIKTGSFLMQKPSVFRVSNTYNR